jgi:Kef-type K+ transport system membrane component KefB
MIQPEASIQSIVINAVIVIAFVLFMFLFISRIKDLATRRKKRISERKKAIALSNGEDVCGCETEQPMEELGALGLAILVCMGLAAVSVNIGLAAIIGAFFAGMIFAEFKDTVPCEHNFNVITYFMLPFFFLWVGMEVQFDRVLEYGADIVILLVAVLIVAIITKYVAGFLGSKTGKLPNDSSHLVAVSFIPRGEVGIIVATLGLRYGVFDTPVFTVIILMALITSMVAPPFITRAYLKVEKNRAETEISPNVPGEERFS